MIEIADNVEKENRILFPLMSNGEVFGIVKLSIDKQFLSEDLFSVLNISFRSLFFSFISFQG